MTQKNGGNGPAGEAGRGRALTPLQYLQSNQCLLDDTGPELREKIDQIAALMRKHERRSVLDYYQIGKVILDIKEDEERDAGTRYGRQSMKKLVAALPWCASLLYDCLRLAGAYTQEQIEDIADLHLQSGEPLTWSHLRLLAKITDPRRRGELQMRTVQESWTCDDLAHEFVRLSNPDGPRRPPRRPSAPRHLDGLIRQQQACAGPFLERAEAYWNEDEFSLTRFFRELPQAKCTEEGARKLQEHVERLRRVARTADAQAREGQEVLNAYRERLKARGAAGAEAGPAGEEIPDDEAAEGDEVIDEEEPENDAALDDENAIDEEAPEDDDAIDEEPTDDDEDNDDSSEA